MNRCVRDRHQMITDESERSILLGLAGRACLSPLVAKKAKHSRHRVGTFQVSRLHGSWDGLVNARRMESYRMTRKSERHWMLMSLRGHHVALYERCLRFLLRRLLRSKATRKHQKQERQKQRDEKPHARHPKPRPTSVKRGEFGSIRGTGTIRA